MSNISWFHDKKRSKFTFRHHFCSCSFWWRTSHADNSLTLCFSVNICFLKKKWMKPSGCDAVAAACSPENITLWIICCWSGLSSCTSLLHCLTLNYHISKTAVTLCTDDEIFNDAWVSALHRPESCGSYWDVPWGPRLPDRQPPLQSLDLVSRKRAPGSHL